MTSERKVRYGIYHQKKEKLFYCLYLCGRERRDQTEMGNSHFLSGGIEAQGGDRESEKLQLLPSAHQSEYCGVPVRLRFTLRRKAVGRIHVDVYKRQELFASINGRIVSVPVEPENPLRTAEMTLEDDYGMIDGIINNGRRGEELEKTQAEARRTTPEKKPSIRERLEDAKRECAERKGPDKPAPQKKPPELGDL